MRGRDHSLCSTILPTLDLICSPLQHKMSSARASPKHVQACSYCRKRKVKCDGSETCSNCVNHGKICFYPPSQRGKGRRLRPPNTVEDRLSRLETLIQVANHGGNTPVSILGMDQDLPGSTGQYGFSHEPTQPPVDPHNQQSPGMILGPPVQQLLATPSANLSPSARVLTVPDRASSALSRPVCSTLSRPQFQAGGTYSGRSSSEAIRTPTHVIPTHRISSIQPPRIWEHHGK